jgi:hypothetical protein
MNWKVTFRGIPPKTPTASGGYPHTPTVIIFLVSLIVLEILTISLLWKPTLPLTVRIVRVYDVGDVGYWDVVCLNVTNHGNSAIHPIFLLNEFGSEKRWVVSVMGTTTPPAYAPYNCTLPVIPPHSSRLINISAPSPLYFIPPFTPIYVQVYSGFNFANSPIYVTPNITRPPIINPNFSVIYYSGKYNEVLPWGWYVELAPGTKLTYHNGVIVNGTAVFYQPVFVNVTVTGYNISYTVSDNVLFIYVHNGYVRGVIIGS